MKHTARAVVGMLLLTVCFLTLAALAPASPEGAVVPLADADLTLLGVEHGDWAAYSASLAGDMNGDGFDDIVIGAPRSDGDGRAYLVLGRPRDQWPSDEISLSEADASFLGCLEGGMTGRQNYAAGDVNGDGYDDLLISGWKCADTQPYQGKAFLFLGRPAANWGQDFPVVLADASFLGEHSYDFAAYYVSTAGDVNADGYDDMLVTCPDCDPVGESSGQVYLLLGRAAADWGRNYPLAQADASFIGEGEGDSVGRAATGVGDVNGDGYGDLLIGSVTNDDGGTDAGKVWLILGRPEADWGLHYSLSLADASFVGESPGDEAGRRVAWAGDVDGDGLDDMVVGASRNEQAGAEAGKAYLILGRAAADWGLDLPLAQADAGFLGEAAGDQAGRRVAGAGDVDGDGFDDFLIGAPHNSRGGLSAGAAYLIRGRSAADWGSGFPLSQADAIYVGEFLSQFTGYDVSRAGDMDGDGLDDLLIGAYGGKVQLRLGRAYVVYGAVQVTPQPLEFEPDAPQGRVGEWHDFSSVYRDPNGWADIASSRLLLGVTVDDQRALNALYQAADNTLWLRNSTDTDWLGPCTPGESVRLRNGTVQLDCSLSSVSHDGAELLLVVWHARWTRPLVRPRSLTAYLSAVDQDGHDSGFVPLGTWTLEP